MNLISKNNFIKLANNNNKYCISTYIPKFKIENREDLLVGLQRQVTLVESQLLRIGLNDEEISNYLSRFNELLIKSNLLKQLNCTLSIFINEKSLVYYSIPIEVNEFSIVSDRFYLLPLLSSFNTFDKIDKSIKQKYSAFPNKTISSINKVVMTALDGSVDTLFVIKNVFVWGDYNNSTDEVMIYKYRKKLDNCLLDLAARATFQHGGQIIIVEPGELPNSDAVVNAILK